MSALDPTLVRNGKNAYRHPTASLEYSRVGSNDEADEKSRVQVLVRVDVSRQTKTAGTGGLGRGAVTLDLG
jgi:hypothetical protein